MKPALLDTGVIVALLDRSEKFHQACADAVHEMHAPLITCEAVIAESCYLLRSLPGAPEAVLENVVAGIFQIPFQLSRDAPGVKQALRKYRDRKIDLADACLIRLADEFETPRYFDAGQRLCDLSLEQEQTLPPIAALKVGGRASPPIPVSSPRVFTRPSPPH